MLGTCNVIVEGVYYPLNKAYNKALLISQLI
jgi:hypothetical protein